MSDDDLGDFFSIEIDSHGARTFAQGARGVL
jgi:hypothetical protein